jgi:serine O-acetyltransferase
MAIQRTLPARCDRYGEMSNPAVEPEPHLRLSALLAGDLFANTGRSGFFAGLLSSVSDPSFSTVAFHRIVCALRASGWMFLAKLLWRWNVILSGCLIHPEAKIGIALRLPHPTAVVVGTGARIGNFVTIYQGVTLGRGLNDERYPTLAEGVVIFPNSVIAGGVTVGRGAVVGAGSVVLADVPANAVVTGNPARILRMRNADSASAPTQPTTPTRPAPQHAEVGSGSS